MTEPGAPEPDEHEPHRTHESPIQRILVESALIVFNRLLGTAANTVHATVRAPAPADSAARAPHR